MCIWPATAGTGPACGRFPLRLGHREKYSWDLAGEMDVLQGFARHGACSEGSQRNGLMPAYTKYVDGNLDTDNGHFINEPDPKDVRVSSGQKPSLEARFATARLTGIRDEQNGRSLSESPRNQPPARRWPVWLLSRASACGSPECNHTIYRPTARTSAASRRPSFPCLVYIGPQTWTRLPRSGCGISTTETPPPLSLRLSLSSACSKWDMTSMLPSQQSILF
ncbi:hypothetical protein LX36DRAFT_124516 [Colletotrichum falcatum]|nr:hypothetical protein LX36DRAFT_124516 [Colletotrichum falcatum]